MKFFKNLTLSLFSMLLLVVSACAAAKEEFSLCLASAGSPAEVVKVEKRLGRFDCLKRYRNLAALSPAEIPDAYSKDVGRFLDAGYEVFLVVTLPGMTLADINAGKADERVVALAEAIAADGREVTLVLLHEANGGTYSWSVRDGATPADFVSAWRRLVGLIREVAPNARFDLNYNRVSAYRKGNDTPESRVADFAAYFPGGDWVDSVSISGFNRCGTSRWHRRWLSFGEVIDLAYRKLSSFVPKEIPIRIAETGTTSLCGGDKARWYINMGFDSGEKRWPRLAGLTLFLEKISAGKASNERVIHWAPETEYQWRALAAALAFVRQERRSQAEHPFRPKIRHLGIIGSAGKTNGKASYPWTIRGSLSATADRPNTAINPVTGEPFGGKGLQGEIYFSQGWRWPVADGRGKFTQLLAYAGAGLSNEPNRWWANYRWLGTRLEYCRSRPEFAAWGRLCWFADLSATDYVVPVPPRLEGWSPALAVGASVNIGGSERWW